MTLTRRSALGVVEKGSAERLFADPAHPDTRVLVGAVPVPGRRQREERVRLNGEPRSPIDPDPNACRLPLIAAALAG